MTQTLLQENTNK